MVTWKDIACKRYCVDCNAGDNAVLDEILRNEMPGVSRLLSMRDQLGRILTHMVIDGTVTQKASGDLTRAIVAVVHPFRVRIVEKYRAEAVELNKSDTALDDYQPRADYQD